MKTALLCLALCCSPVLAQTDRLFGYVGVACGHDDPHDSSTLDDYTAEVASFTNLAHVCLSPDPAVTADRLQRVTATGGTALLAVEPVLFAQAATGLTPNPDRATLWPLVQQAITTSGVGLDQILFYVVDEPTLRGLPLPDLSDAIAFLHQTYPTARTLVIEAYDAAGPTPILPQIDYWGFDAYGVPDPSAEPLYTTYLDRALALLGPDQRFMVVMDAMHTPIHADLGITLEGMADVARAYLALATSRPDIAGIIGYAWVGGIDGLHERGVRDLPPAVQAAHREIGLAWLGR